MKIIAIEPPPTQEEVYTVQLTETELAIMCKFVSYYNSSKLSVLDEETMAVGQAFRRIRDTIPSKILTRLSQWQMRL